MTRVPLGRLSMVWRPTILIVLASVAAVLWVHRVHPVWFVPPIVHIDPWLYWGTGEDFGYLGEHWGSTYYFRRWTLVLPNYIFQHLLSPYDAQFALRSALFFGVCLFSGLFTFRLTGARSAALLTIYGFTYPDFLVRSIGLSYNQGTGLLLFFAAAWLVMRMSAPSARALGRVGQGVAIGAVLGLLFVTYPWTLYLWFTFGVLGLFQVASWSGPRSERLVSLGLVLAGAAIGFALIVALDLQVARIFGVRWPNVVTYAFDVGKGLTSGKGIAPADFLVKQVLTSSSYALIGVVVAGVLFVFGKRLLPGGIPLAWTLLVLSATYLLDPWTKANSHFVMQTIIYLTALLIVAVAVLFASAFNNAWQQGSMPMRLITVAALSVVGVLWWRQMGPWTAVNWWVPVTAAAIAVPLQGVVRLLTERRIVWTVVLVLASTSSALALATTLSI